MLVIIIGPSGSGKTTVSNVLRDDYNFKEIISYTTRQKRENEKYDVDYHFVDNITFHNMIKKGEFAEYEEYSGMRFYGTTLEDIKKAANDEENNYCMVITPGGMRNILKQVDKDKILTVLIDAPLVTRVKRYIGRCKDFSMGDLDELHARTNRDEGMFKGVDTEVDMVLQNDGQTNVAVLAKQIESICRGREVYER